MASSAPRGTADSVDCRPTVTNLDDAGAALYGKQASGLRWTMGPAVVELPPAAKMVPVHVALAPGVSKLGMAMMESPRGLVVVRQVTPRGWAHKKGIRPGDVLVAIDGTARVFFVAFVCACA
jgi:hypothetical protein